MPFGSSFGELLKQFRQRRGLSQHRLAELVECHRNSISLWERDLQLPETQGMLLALTRALELHPDEQRLLFEARYGTASVIPVDNLPLPRNPYFTGREALLEYLHQHLQVSKQVALTQAISGLGGIGKTQTALEYAYRYRTSYHEVLWVGADSREALVTEVASLAALLHLPEQQEQEQHKIVAAVKRWLSGHHHWLLVLDNLEDLGLIHELLPPRHQGAVILTTRRRVTGPVAQVVELDVMPEDEGTLFLLRRAGYLSVDTSPAGVSPHDEVTARTITRLLGGLPLALDQAGAYIEETRCSLAAYQNLYRSQPSVLLKRRGSSTHDYPASVATTWSLSFERVEQQNQVAAELLRCCAFLYPDAIPEEFFTEGAVHLGTRLQQLGHNPLAFDEAAQVLLNYSLIRRDPTKAMLSVHRLVQAVVKDAVEESFQLDWILQIVRAANETFPEVEFMTWQQCERCLPFALACAMLVEQKELMLLEAASLLNRIGHYLYARARYNEAEPLFLRALAIQEQQLDPGHPSITASLSDLAECYREQGKYEQAELLHRRALAIDEETLGPHHPDVGIDLNNLALIYYYQGKYEQAEPLFLRALAIKEQQLGSEHPRTARSLNNLAALYRAQGKYEQAGPLYRRTLAIREQQFGPEHPDTAKALNNLALLLDSQEKYEQAELLHRRALTIREQQLGLDHPHTAQSLANLARIYHAQGKYEAAEQLCQRSLTIREQQLGPQHPDTAHSLHWLAVICQQQQRYEQAEPLYQRALAIREQQLGLEHLDTATSLYGLATLYQTQGKYGQAESLYQRALAIREHVLGPHHPWTRAIREHYISFLRTLEREDEARQMETQNEYPAPRESVSADEIRTRTDESLM